MIDALLAGFLLFRGAGPGAAEGFHYQVLPAAGGPTVSQRIPQQGELTFLRAGPRSQSVTGLRNFGGHRQVLVDVPLNGKPIRELGYVEGSALFYPVLSPDGTMVAALMAPGRTDLPPRGFSGARLVVFPILPPVAADGTPNPVTGYRVLATELTVVPPDWSADGKLVFFVSRQKGQEHVAMVDLQSGTTQLIAPGVLPRASPDGRSLAFVREHSVVVVSLPELRQQHSHVTEWAIAWLAWSPEGTGLAIGESGPVYRSRLSVLNNRNGQFSVLAETGPIKDLCWLADKPIWSAR